MASQYRIRGIQFARNGKLQRLAGMTTKWPGAQVYLRQGAQVEAISLQSGV